MPIEINPKSDNFPFIVNNPMSHPDLDECIDWVKTNKSDLKNALSQSGAILFRGFPITSPEAFDLFSAAFEYKPFTYQESLSNAVRINYTERVFTANEAPPEVEIYLHHEMAQTPIAPSRLFFFCKAAAEHGGATPLCRSDWLLEKFTELHPVWTEKFTRLGLKYTTNMPLEDDSTSGQGRSWKSTLSVDNKSSAEAKLNSLGYSWKWLDGGRLLATTPVLPAIKNLENGSRSFYNQLIAAYEGWQGVKANPDIALTFGDGSSIPAEALDAASEISTELIVDLNWQDGDIALVDNTMTMHGRRPYSGARKRQVLVALAAN